MTSYRVIYWKHIPTMVIASDDDGKARASLPPRFQAAVDAYAMAEGSSDDDSYSAGWHKGPWVEREGSAQEVADAVAAELEAAHPKIRTPRRASKR